MLPGVVSNFLEGSKADPYSWWTKILVSYVMHKKTPVHSARNRKPPTSTWFARFLKHQHLQNKVAKNSILEIPLWTECVVFFFFHVMNFPQQTTKLHGGLPVAVDLELLWLEFRTDLLVIFFGSASRNCYWKNMPTLWCGRCTGMMYRWRLLILFLVIWRVCGFVCSTNAISRSTYAGCCYTSLMQWQKVMRFSWNIIYSSCTSHVLWKVIIQLMLPPRVHECPVQ